MTEREEFEWWAHQFSAYGQQPAAWAAWQAAKRQAWINVHYQLPPEGVSVLIAMKDGRIEKTCLHRGEFLRSSAEQPTHWMPLPPPPASDTVSDD
jgi:hypothetical protein